MIPYVGCDAAREMLQPFVDGELSMADQVALESHLRWCSTCGARVEDLRLIGASLRLGARANIATPDNKALQSLQSEVLTRIRTEHDQAFSARVREVFDERRYLWQGLGATAALVLCVCAVTGVNRAARAIDPDSMADRIQMLASPGSDRNPLHLNTSMLAPRPVIDGHVLAQLSDAEDEASYALAAVVTREGRVANYEVLQSERAQVLRRSSAAQTADVSQLMDVVTRSRFTPAQRGSGEAVAVSLVWVLERTTVRAPRQAYTGLVPLPAPVDVVVKPLNGPLNGVVERPAPRPARS